MRYDPKVFKIDRFPQIRGVVQKHFPQVRTAEDATNRLEIEVMDVDTRTGKRKKATHCALAEACKRQEGVDGVIILRRTVYLIRGEKLIRYHVPETVSREIVSFDRGAAFMAGRYHLAPVNKGVRLGSMNLKRKSTASGTGQPRLIRTRVHRTEGIRVFSST